MLKKIYKHYWQIGFKTHLYDLLAPEAYIDSLRQSAESIPEPVDSLLDAGCGSGLGFSFYKNNITPGGYYAGIDILAEGLNHLKVSGQTSNFKGWAILAQADLNHPIPFRPNSFDVVIAHFSIYTLGSKSNRVAAWRELFSVVRKGGVLIASNPSEQFNPSKIIASSLEILENKNTSTVWHRFLLYPATRALGLNHIFRQLKSGNWKAYTEHEFKEEVSAAGFELDSVKSVYGGSGILLKAFKP